MYREYGHMGDQLVLANSDIENSICMRLGISDSQLTVWKAILNTPQWHRETNQQHNFNKQALVT